MVKNTIESPMTPTLALDLIRVTFEHGTRQLASSFPSLILLEEGHERRREQHSLVRCGALRITLMKSCLKDIP